MVITRASQFKHTVSCTVKPQAALTWCVEQFGPRWEATGCRTGVWAVFWGGFRRLDWANGATYDWHFLNEQDAMLFSLKWL